jgi:hypothetical protein
MYEYGTMTPDDVILRRGRGRGRMMEGMNLRYIVGTYMKIIMYPSYTTNTGY